MQLYSKAEIDRKFLKAFYETPRVNLVKLSEEDIAKYKSKLNAEKSKATLPQRNEHEQEENKCEESREGDTDAILTISTDDEKISRNESNNNNNNQENVILMDDKSTNNTTKKMENQYKPLEAMECSNSSKTSVFTLINSTTKHSVQKKKISLVKIECLYQKYFSKSFKNNIVVIANILNIILICNEFYTSKLKKSLKKKSKFVQCIKFYDAKVMRLTFKKVLISKLKKYFMEVVSEFVYSEFELSFQLLFMSIVCVLRHLDKQKYKNGSIFKNVILLLRDTFKEKSEYGDHKIFEIINSNRFRHDCINLFNIIKESRNSDPDITHSMPLFFVSSINSKANFQMIIDAMNSSYENITLLVEAARFLYLCYLNSKCDVSLDLSSSKTKNNINTKTPVTSVKSSITIVDSCKLVSDKTLTGNLKHRIGLKDTNFCQTT